MRSYVPPEHRACQTRTAGEWVAVRDAIRRRATQGTEETP